MVEYLSSAPYKEGTLMSGWKNKDGSFFWIIVILLLFFFLFNDD